MARTLRESRWLEAERLKQQQARILRDAVLDQALEVTTVQRATLAGDTRRLRGLPAVARGVGGAMPGTQPEAEVVGRLSRRG